MLQIVLRLGDIGEVPCTVGSGPETLDAIRQVAERYGVSADLTGVVMRDGRPIGKGMFEDPGGQAGMRYWDGSRWSPLLVPVSRRWLAVRRSAASWADLPVAQEPWDHPSVRTARLKAWIAVCGALTCALLVTGLALGIASRQILTLCEADGP